MRPVVGLAPDSPSLKDLGGAVWSIDTSSIPGAFNPAICRAFDGRLALVARRTNYTLDTEFGALQIPSGSKSVVNASYFSYLSENLFPTGWQKIKFTSPPDLSRGVEDARLLRRGSDWYLNVVMLESHTPRARVAIYKLSDDLIAEHIKTYDGQTAGKPEKNWMALLESDDLNFDFVSCMPDNIRGGSSLIPWGDGYLAICHTTYLHSVKYYNPYIFGVQDGIKRTYTHRFVVFDRDLKITGKSKEFFLISRGIEFATGLIEIDKDLVISFGRDDKESWFGKISITAVEKMLKEGA